MDYWLTFDRGELKAETISLSYFQVAAWQGKNGYLFGLAAQGDAKYRIKVVVQNETLPSKSFAVQRNPDRSPRECRKDQIDGLNPSTCFGDLEIKSLEDFYKSKIQT